MIWNFKHFQLKMTASLLALILLTALFISPATAQDQGFDLERIEQATVFIMQATASSSQLIIDCIGSGTLVSRDGLILANAHNTVTNHTCPGDTLIVAMSVHLDEPPVPIYRAKIAQADPGLDLALLRITSQNDGRLVDPSTLTLPFVELGDSAALSQ